MLNHVLRTSRASLSSFSGSPTSRLRYHTGSQARKHSGHAAGHPGIVLGIPLHAVSLTSRREQSISLAPWKPQTPSFRQPLLETAPFSQNQTPWIWSQISQKCTLRSPRHCLPVTQPGLQCLWHAWSHRPAHARVCMCVCVRTGASSSGPASECCHPTRPTSTSSPSSGRTRLIMALALPLGLLSTEHQWYFAYFNLFFEK